MTVIWSFARNYLSPPDLNVRFLAYSARELHSLTILPLAWVDPTKTSALQSLLFFFSRIEDLNY